MSLLLRLVLLVSVVVPVAAQTPGDLAAGALVGAPLGVGATVKFTTEWLPLEADLGWNFSDVALIQLSGLPVERPLPNATNQFYYLGLGATVGIYEEQKKKHTTNAETLIGPHALVGLLLRTDEFEVFGHLSPILFVNPEVRFVPGLAAGVRYVL